MGKLIPLFAGKRIIKSGKGLEGHPAWCQCCLCDDVRKGSRSRKRTPMKARPFPMKGSDSHIRIFPRRQLPDGRWIWESADGRKKKVL